MICPRKNMNRHEYSGDFRGNGPIRGAAKAQSRREDSVTQSRLDGSAGFDGRGHEFLAKVSTAARRDVRVQLLNRVEPAAEAGVPLTLAQAVLKGEKMDEVVRDAVMLGVAAIQPLVTARAETTIAALLRSGKVDRWRRVAIASVKQSRRAVVPHIQTPLTPE